ncbi:HEAT repeat domain-containing protein [Cellvibrio sp. PSBB006]|uniref:HEAT repeat domain-containing protein n=1 Tax=Cellvibrio sp. PSBB006 TaxID=1987723 RepID=UPI000B3B6923|nr:HEAT repeat domain-containing protein [Cellvibrio sp. PSBB006]ARU28475.1 hypothetical protein CBR65_14080 [Cellvibrio sp. PSBB006]
MSLTVYTKKHLLLAAAVGALTTYMVIHPSAEDAETNPKITALENKIIDLEIILAKKEQELLDARLFAFDSAEQQRPIEKKTTTTTPDVVTAMQAEEADVQAAISESTAARDQAVKDLVTQTENDPRSLTEKINELLASNPSRENLAIASKSLYDMAENPTILPDYALSALYHNQTNPDIKRVAAQVMSLRGDNTLIEKQITDAQTGLSSPNPETRQKTLVELAKTRYHSAADAIAPLLQDKDIGVKLDALLALRATGNESHVYLAQALVNHPDESVSWLAKDVISDLQILSDRARTQIASTDIVAELPVAEAP